jgi:uncharacterized protein YkwD
MTTTRGVSALVLLCLGLGGCEALGGDGTEPFAFTDLELEVHEQVNDYREQQGLAPLELDAFVGELSRSHSDDMASGAVPFGHDGFDDRAALIVDDGARGVGENVAFNQGFDDPATVAVQGWIESPPHHENMVGNFTHAGVGIAETDDGIVYLTQMFSLR